MIVAFYSIRERQTQALEQHSNVDANEGAVLRRTIPAMMWHLHPPRDGRPWEPRCWKMQLRAEEQRGQGGNLEEEALPQQVMQEELVAERILRKLHPQAMLGTRRVV